jgi:hypothetical protein
VELGNHQGEQMGGRQRFERSEVFLGFEGPASGFKYPCEGGRATRHGWPIDPAAYRAAPGDPTPEPGDPVSSRTLPVDPTRVAGRPGCLQNRAGSTGQPCRLTRLAQKRLKET